MEIEAPAAQEPGDLEAETATAPSKSRNEVLYFPTCGTDDARPDGCWVALAAPADCVLWWDRGAPRPSETINWSGACDDTLRASGRGTLEWRDWSESGELIEGKQHGHWIERSSDGYIREGPYVDGKRHGHWVERWADGDEWEGPYVDGKRHGRWALRYGNGWVFEGPFVNGKQHGHWAVRSPDGYMSEGLYVDSKMHGRWVTRYSSGRTEVIEYRHGEWVD